MTKKIKYLELFFYIILSNLYINIIGMISIGELWVFVVTPFILRKNLFLQYPLLKKIAILYLLYFISQLISELVIGNTFDNIAKGLMVTVVSFLTLLFLFDRLRNNLDLVVLIFFFISISSLYYINSAGLGEAGVSFGLENNSYFKYKITPILTNLVLFISFFLLRKGYKRLTILLFFTNILLYIAFSARSASLILFFCAIVLLFGENIVKNKHRIIPGLLIVIVLSYGAYFGWVKYQLTGELKIRNEQIDRMSNPYNPLEMLQKGRGEFFVGLEAFADSFLWGNGAWVKGKDKNYLIELEKLQNNVNASTEYVPGVIPVHSVIVGAAVNNGIFAFIFMLSIIIYFIRIQFSVFRIMIKTPMAMIFLSQIIGLMWTSLFSPLPHFRLSLPLMFALTLVFYTKTEKYKRYLYLKNRKKSIIQGSIIDNQIRTNSDLSQ